MIEQSPFTSNIARIGVEHSQFESTIEGMQQYSFSESRGFGFSIENMDEDSISAYLVERDPIKLKEFDGSSETIIETEDYQTTIIPFEMNFDQKLLQVFSDQPGLSKVISRIGEAIRWSFPIDGATLDLNTLYTELREKGMMTNLTSVRIRNFQTESGFSGTYTVKGGIGKSISQFMEGDRGNVTVMRGEIETSGDRGKVGFYRSGSIRLYSRVERDCEFWSGIENVANSAIIE